MSEFSGKTEYVESAGGGQRIALLDLWRFLAMCLMPVGHAVWDLAQFGVIDPALWDSWWMLLLRYGCAGSFILISGAAAAYSRDPKRRGFLALCAGAVVCFVTALMGQPVRFGILELLGVSLLLYGWLKPRLSRPPGWLWCLCFLLTLPLLWLRVRVSWLYPLGLRSPGFFSADWWPLLPWGFLFLTGTRLGPVLARLRQPKLPRAVSFLARHSLLFYLLHQVLLYGVCFLLWG